MRKVVSFLAALPAGLVLAGCATGGAPAPGQPDPAVARGQAFAQRACSGCHAIGPVGDSPNSSSPPFRSLRMQFTEPSLRHHLQLISRNGHYQMPPIYITPDEIADVAAYIRTVRAPAAP